MDFGETFMPYNFTWNTWPDMAGVKDALPLLLDIYRGNSVEEEDVAFAMFNGGGFAYNMIRGQNDPPIFGATSATKEEVEQAFSQAIAASNNPATMAASPVGSAWLTILVPVLIDLFKKWLDRRG
jgi:hypothetical protein